ncbi:MAG: nickel-dependent hydrogenase large subunit [Candidatus Moduliflexus flocculans]|nr:nickel-dependent hydrogenase large subunit [Candidatus Moduliflexus flocculans]
MVQWADQIVIGQSPWTPYTTPTQGAGVGLTEAPRGALGHWLQIANGKISRYQIITPTCWNASPGDDLGKAGPLEQALVGTPVQDPAQPIEVLRVIHSFDPCLSCAVHVLEPKTRSDHFNICAGANLGLKFIGCGYEPDQPTIS